MKPSGPKVSRIRYESEGSDRRASGAVTLHDGGWWSIELIVAIHQENQILLTLHHHRTAGEEEVGNSVDLCLRPSDLEALPVLLNGVIAQARRDGVIPSRAVVRRKRVRTTTAQPLYEKKRATLAPPSVDEPEVGHQIHVASDHYVADPPAPLDDSRLLRRSHVARAPLRFAHAVG